MLEVRALSKRFGGLKAISDLDLKVDAGEFLGIMGPNGAGKTTLLNLMTGYLTPSAGTMLFEGRPIEGLAPFRICRAGIRSDRPCVQPSGARGTGPHVHRGESSYNRYNGDRTHGPNPCLAPIEVGPFYAVRIHMGELGTFAGIVTNARAQALDAAGRPIAGLYAAGNDQSHVMAGDYMGGGATLGPALTFGYIAGCEIAGEHVPIDLPGVPAPREAV